MRRHRSTFLARCVAQRRQQPQNHRSGQHRQQRRRSAPSTARSRHMACASALPDQHKEEHQPHEVTKEESTARPTPRRPPRWSPPDGARARSATPRRTASPGHCRSASSGSPAESPSCRRPNLTPTARTGSSPRTARSVSVDLGEVAQQQDAAQRAASGEVEPAAERSSGGGDHVSRQIGNSGPVRREYRPERPGGPHRRPAARNFAGSVGIIEQRRHVGDQQRSEQRGGQQPNARPPCAAPAHGVGRRGRA